MASGRAKTRSTRSQTCMKYGGINICNRKNSDVNTGDLKILHKKRQNKVDFPDVIFNFSKMVCILPSTLCMTGELWPRRFIWHQDIRVTYCQSSAMSFIFSHYSFCNSFRHGLICCTLRSWFHAFLGQSPHNWRTTILWKGQVACHVKGHYQSSCLEVGNWRWTLDCPHIKVITILWCLEPAKSQPFLYTEHMIFLWHLKRLNILLSCKQVSSV